MADVFTTRHPTWLGIPGRHLGELLARVGDEDGPES